MIQALIVDDKRKSQEILLELIQANCPEVNVQWTATSIEEAIVVIEDHCPQLVFLDIELKDGTGFDILRKAKNRNYKVIFVTGFSHYAIKAIRFSALDYLLKPVDADDLKLAVEKAVNEIDATLQRHPVQELMNNLENAGIYKLAIPVKDGFVYLDPLEVVRMEADGAYTHIFCLTEKYYSSKNIKEYETMLDGMGFFRCHHSHLINLKRVKKFTKMDGFFVEMEGGSLAEISRRNKAEFLTLMNKS